MIEKPNLNYINEIANGNKKTKERLITIIKKEFPDEEKEFMINYKANRLIKAAENIHKIKHKINLLGLQESYEIAEKFEEELKKGIVKNFNNFTIILQTIRIYLKEL